MPGAVLCLNRRYWKPWIAGECALKMIQIVALTFLGGLVAERALAKDQILWMYDMDAALIAAQKENKPLMIDFMAEWCAPCKQMEASTFSNPAIVLKAKAFIPVRIDVDKQQKVAARYNALPRAYGGVGIPNMLFLSSVGMKLKHTIGFADSQKMLGVMNFVLKKSAK
jgi:thiol:disulfide interchange protein